MRPLIIDETGRQKIKAVREYAEKNRFSLPLLMGIREGSEPAAGFDPGLVCEIPLGFRVVFSIEEHPCGWCHHLSVSLTDGGGRVANPHAVRLIMEEFGIKRKLEDCVFDVEDCEPKAVSIIAPFPALHEAQN